MWHLLHCHSRRRPTQSQTFRDHQSLYKLYIQSGHVKPFAQQIEANPKVEICAFNGKEWIRANGILVEDTRIEAKKSMLDAYPELRGMYDENDGNTAVYYIKDGKATISSFTAKPVEIEF